MAVDKLVDSAQLNTDLTAVANAIRAKSGGSTPLAFPGGFVSEIGSIQTGGGGMSWQDYFEGRIPDGRIVLAGDATKSSQFTIGAFGTSRYTLFLTGQRFYTSAIRAAKRCTIMVFPSILNCYGAGFQFADNSNLEKIDLGDGLNKLQTNAFFSDSGLKTIILRANNVVPMDNTNALANNTPFKSGGAGGTIYIPKVLYDHLGDGSALDYKAATNWSTIDGYGTITWAQIEGSIYETQYADGTPIT